MELLPFSFKASRLVKSQPLRWFIRRWSLVYPFPPMNRLSCTRKSIKEAPTWCWWRIFA